MLTVIGDVEARLDNPIVPRKVQGSYTISGVSPSKNQHQHFIISNKLIKITLNNPNYEFYDAADWFYDPTSKVVYRISTVFNLNHQYRLRYINGNFINNFGNIVPESDLGHYK